jgi:small subunit ribosomal protein S5
MRPASPGTGVIAGGAVRAIMECMGVKDVLSKSLGSPNPHNVVKAAFAGLERCYDAVMMARKRECKVTDLFK